MVEKANLDEGGEEDDQDGAVVEALVVRPVVLCHHGKGNSSPEKTLKEQKTKKVNLSPPTTMTACQRQLMVSVRSLFSTRHKPQVTISLDHFVH